MHGPCNAIESHRIGTLEARFQERWLGCFGDTHLNIQCDFERTNFVIHFCGISFRAVLGRGRDAFDSRQQASKARGVAEELPNISWLAPNDDYNAIAYVRPGAAGSEFSVDLLTADGRSVQGVPRLTREADRETLGPKDVLYLSVGGKMAEMKHSLLGLPALARGAADDAAEQKGTVQFAYIENDFDMPDLWFGYEAADVVILVTRNEKFINDLNSDNGPAPQGAGGMGAPRR